MFSTSDNVVRVEVSETIVCSSAKRDWRMRLYIGE